MNRWYRFVVAELQFRLAASRWQEGAGRTTTVAVCLGAALTALLWWALGGYHAQFLTLNRLLSPVPADVVALVTYAGDSLVGLSVLLLFARRAPHLLWLGTLSAIVAAILSRALKALVASARPPAVLPHDAFRLVGPPYLSQGFPSGHATTAFTVAAVLGWGLPDRGRRWLLFALAAAIAVSRIAAGVHWPLDVLAGAAVGSGSVLLAAPLARRWRWGLTAPVQLALVAILAACAASLWVIAIPYPQAAGPARLLSAAALALTLWDYAWVPLRRR